MTKFRVPLSRLLLLGALTTMSLWADSCKKSEDPPAPDMAIEGSYKITSLQAEPKVLGVYNDLIAASKLLFNGTTCLVDIAITFKTGGTATTDDPATCKTIPVPVSTFTGIDANSKWVINGDKLTVTKGDGTKTEYTVLSRGSMMKLQWQGVLNYPVPSPTIYTYTMDLQKK